jgi:hypothetical protein
LDLGLRCQERRLVKKPRQSAGSLFRAKQRASQHRRITQGGCGVNTDDLKMCNCAGCQKELLSRDHIEFIGSLPEVRRRAMPEFVAGRVSDRPYCDGCLEQRSVISEQWRRLVRQARVQAAKNQGGSS